MKLGYFISRSSLSSNFSSPVVLEIPRTEMQPPFLFADKINSSEGEN
jgi:hypothetical protein